MSKLSRERQQHITQMMRVEAHMWHTRTLKIKQRLKKEPEIKESKKILQFLRKQTVITYRFERTGRTIKG